MLVTRQLHVGREFGIWVQFGCNDNEVINDHRVPQLSIRGLL